MALKPCLPANNVCWDDWVGGEMEGQRAPGRARVGEVGQQAHVATAPAPTPPPAPADHSLISDWHADAWSTFGAALAAGGSSSSSNSGSLVDGYDYDSCE